MLARLLAQRPTAPDPGQAALGARWLAPSRAELEALFRHLRASVNPELSGRRPRFGGKPYPLGQCLWITDAVLDRITRGAVGELSAPAAAGWAALCAFREHGGVVRRAWGDLRGQYFQNALLLGDLYVDVSNDTVVIDKPPVEILPLAAADFRPIADFAHYARIAARYWKHEVFPNHLLPQLAPYLPLVEVAPTGRVMLGSFNHELLGLTLAGGFAPSAAFLARAAMPPGLFAGVAAALQGGPLTVGVSGAAGRAAALAACADFEARGLAESGRAFDQAMAAGRAANGALARVVALPQAA